MTVIRRRAAGGGGASTSPIFSDSFAVDSRSAYTYLIGAASNLAVAGGVLQEGSASQNLFVPTSLAARKSHLSKVKITIPSDGVAHFPGLCLKAIDSSNHVYATLNTDSNSIDLWKIVGGTATTVQSASVSGGVRTTLWLLGGCLGNVFFCNVYTADPETTAAAPAGSATGNVADTALRGNVAGKPGIESFNHSGHTFDDFKVWAAGAHPFDL